MGIKTTAATLAITAAVTLTGCEGDGGSSTPPDLPSTPNSYATEVSPNPYLQQNWELPRDLTIDTIKSSLEYINSNPNNTLELNVNFVNSTGNLINIYSAIDPSTFEYEIWVNENKIDYNDLERYLVGLTIVDGEISEIRKLNPHSINKLGNALSSILDNPYLDPNMDLYCRDVIRVGNFTVPGETSEIFGVVQEFYVDTNINNLRWSLAPLAFTSLSTPDQTFTFNQINADNATIHNYDENVFKRFHAMCTGNYRNTPLYY